MYEYIKGKVEEIENDYIVVENNFIGYKIYTPNPYFYKDGEEIKIYVYQYVKEDELSFYGFKEKEDLKLFLKLISVKGVGVKTALPFLLTGTRDGIIDAIERENIIYLKKFPKIGEKVAKQIILDLKGKFKDFKISENIYDTDDELYQVLKNLGYKDKEIKEVIKKVDNSKSLEERIKEALKLLLK